MSVQILVGDALTKLRELPDRSVRCCVTSPPYWGLRDYGVSGQLGLEATPAEYVRSMVEVFREVKRVQADTTGRSAEPRAIPTPPSGPEPSCRAETPRRKPQRKSQYATQHSNIAPGARGQSSSRDKAASDRPQAQYHLRRESRAAFALQADGWYLRSDIIWAKPNPMPESVTDRPTKAHEYLFLLSEVAERISTTAKAIAEPGDILAASWRCVASGE